MVNDAVYNKITERIISQLEAGVVPWEKTWTGGLPINYVSRRPYSGVNLLTLPGSGEYITFNQLQDVNHIKSKKGEPLAKIKKGSHGYPVVFFKLNKYEDKATKEEKVIPFIRYTTVFALTDIEGLESKIQQIENNPIEEAEKIVSGFQEVSIKHEDSTKAYYSPSMDYVNVPEINCFTTAENYHSVLFHELVHSTGHKTRLNRFENSAASSMFGSESYSFEELVAEIGAAMLCGITGIDSTLENSASYIQSWLKVLKGDNKMVIKAASKAQDAANYIQGIKKNS
jgi:antirestriction protein ArdC